MINLFQGNGDYSYNATGASAATNFGNWVQDVYGVNGGQHYSTFTEAIDPVTHVGKDEFLEQEPSAFVEDSWKTMSNLTLTVGVRYDTQLVPQPPRPFTTSEMAWPARSGQRSPASSISTTT